MRRRGNKYVRREKERNVCLEKRTEREKHQLGTPKERKNERVRDYLGVGRGSMKNKGKYEIHQWKAEK